MDIKLGIKGEETTFHFVNVRPAEIKARSEHLTIAGALKVQEAYNTYQVYTITWLLLTKDEKNSLLSILRSVAILNLQMEDEDYIDHAVKFRSPIDHGYSKAYPPNYEVIANCAEVG